MMKNKLPNINNELQSIAQEILTNIAKHDGKWSWYELDRSLSYGDNLPLLNNMMPILKQLENENIIRIDSSTSESQPKYWITENGKNFLKNK